MTDEAAAHDAPVAMFQVSPRERLDADQRAWQRIEAGDAPTYDEVTR